MLEKKLNNSKENILMYIFLLFNNETKKWKIKQNEKTLGKK